MVELLDGADAALGSDSLHAEPVVDGENGVTLVIEHPEPRQVLLVAALSTLESPSENEDDRRLGIAVNGGHAARRGEIFIKQKLVAVLDGELVGT